MLRPHLLIAVCAGMLASTSATAQSFPLSALPNDPNGEVFLEAVVTIDSLRAMRAWSREQQQYLRSTALGRAYLDPAIQKKFLGFDLDGEMERWAALAAPSGGPVPVALAVLSRGTDMGAQLMVKVEPGFVERAAASKPGEHGAKWTISGGPDQLRLTLGDSSYSGKVGSDGWLRLATRPDMLLPGGGTSRPLFSPELARWTQSSPMTAAAFGGGAFTRILSGMASDPSTQMMLADVRALALTMHQGKQLDSAVRFLVDAPMLQQFGAMLRRPDLGNTPVGLWDAEAAMLFSVALPPNALAGVMAMGQMMLADSPYAVPEDVAQALSTLEGRVSFAHFGSPSDWAIGVELTDESMAAQLVPALQRWIVGLSAAVGVDAPQSLAALQQFPGLPEPLLHLRPDEVLEGLNVTHVGKTVIAVRQKARLGRVLALAQKKSQSPGAASGDMLDAPLTDVMRGSLARPAILQLYSVANSDGSLLEWFVWPSKALEAVSHALGLANMPTQSPLGTAPYDFSRLPLTLAAAAYASMFIYDYSVSLDLQGPVLMLEIATSQL